jgi:hypothetical protein
MLTAHHLWKTLDTLRFIPSFLKQEIGTECYGSQPKSAACSAEISDQQRGKFSERQIVPCSDG